MSDTSFTLSGIADLTKKLRKLGASSGKVVQVAAVSLYGSCELIMTESKEVYCPIHTGALKSTGHVELPLIEGNQVTVKMGYGGPAAPYAIFVHETDKNYHFGKQWKYLETPLKEGIPKIEEKLAADLNTALENL